MMSLVSESENHVSAFLKFDFAIVLRALSAHIFRHQISRMYSNHHWNFDFDIPDSYLERKCFPCCFCLTSYFQALASIVASYFCWIAHQCGQFQLHPAPKHLNATAACSCPFRAGWFWSFSSWCSMKMSLGLARTSSGGSLRNVARYFFHALWFSECLGDDCCWPFACRRALNWYLQRDRIY